MNGPLALALLCSLGAAPPGEIATGPQEDSVQKIGADYQGAMSRSAGNVSASFRARLAERCFDVALENEEEKQPALLLVLNIAAPEGDEALDEAWTDAVGILIDTYVDDPLIADVVYRLAYVGGARAPQALGALERIEEETTLPSVQAAVAYAHAVPLMRKQRGEALDEKEKKSLLAHLTKAVAGLGDLKTSDGRSLREMAEGGLFDLQNLQVGCKAPDIDGKDLDGVPFKLSDYRGKVVLLDFWGHW